MKKKYLRQVSVAALITDTTRKKVLISRRNPNDSFAPNDIAFPSGRLEGDESIEHRLYQEIEEETGIAVDRNPIYLGECNFQRDDYPVAQLCFGVRAKSNIIVPKRELVDLRFVTYKEFKEEVPDTNYQKNLHDFVQEAIRQGLLRA